MRAIALAAAAATHCAATHLLLGAGALLPSPTFLPVACPAPPPRRAGAVDDGCTPGLVPERGCGRYIEDGFVTAEEAEALLNMTRHGMSRSVLPPDAGGPAILDVNTGFLRDTALQNIYKPRPARAGIPAAPPVAFSPAQLQLYGDVFSRIHARLVRTFNLSRLYFTAPTFVTRIRGAPGWVPASPHDEYYQAHADGLNTPHYALSGLVYLSDAGADFTGGRFRFYGGGEPGEGTVEAEEAALAAGGEPSSGPEDVLIEPRRGRLLLFTSGPENWHRLERVAGGERVTFSMWFTCDPRREFAAFLDGRAHVDFTASSGGGGVGGAGGAGARRGGRIRLMDASDEEAEAGAMPTQETRADGSSSGGAAAAGGAKQRKRQRRRRPRGTGSAGGAQLEPGAGSGGGGNTIIPTGRDEL
jgi:hypothetical protein